MSGVEGGGLGREIKVGNSLWRERENSLENIAQLVEMTAHWRIFSHSFKGKPMGKGVWLSLAMLSLWAAGM